MGRNPRATKPTSRREDYEDLFFGVYALVTAHLSGNLFIWRGLGLKPFFWQKHKLGRIYKFPENIFRRRGLVLKPVSFQIHKLRQVNKSPRNLFLTRCLV